MALNVQLTTAQIAQITQPPVGETVWNTSTEQLEVCDSTGLTADDVAWSPASQLRDDASTTGAVTANMDVRTVVAGEAYTVTAWVTGQQDTQANRATYQLTACFFWDTGGAAAAQQGATSALVTIESDAAWNATLALTGNVIQVQVTGAAGQTINWEAWYEVVRATAS